MSHYSKSKSCEDAQPNRRSRRSIPPHRARDQKGVALLVSITAITILTIVLVDFSRQANIHLNEGVFIRDEVQANVLADTALDITAACLDRKAWGPLGAMQSKVDLQRLCNLLLGVFIRGQIDLPIGGLSVPLDGVEGIKLEQGEIEEVTLTPESSYIGLVGLACPPPNLGSLKTQKDLRQGGTRQLSSMADTMNCASRKVTIQKLNTLFCDPSIAHVFETEQPDGQRYTRAEVIGNLIDWIDPDDNRVNIDTLSIPWRVQEGAGEGEDSYYRQGDERYRSKDSMFDSIEELRLVRGISDELYLYLRDRVSVYAKDKVNMNTASAQVFSALLQAQTPFFQTAEGYTCGQESPTDDMNRALFDRYAKMIVDARRMLQFNRMMSGNFLGQIFRSPRQFINLAKDPINYIAPTGAAQFIDPIEILMTRYQMTEMQYQAIRGGVQWPQMSSSLGTKDQLFRLIVRGKLGQMTRRMTAVLKQDGALVRTLYYRED